MIILKILGYIMLAVALIIGIILILPVYVLIYTDKDNEVQIRYKFLFLTFGDNPNPNSPILKEIKEALGVSKIENAESIKKTVKGVGIATTVSQTVSIIKSLIGRLLWLLKYCRVIKLGIESVSADEDAAGAAMDYGLACAVIYPLVGFIESNLKVKKRAVELDIKCDFDKKESVFNVDIKLSITVIYVVMAFFHIVKENAEKEITKARENGYGKE